MSDVRDMLDSIINNTRDSYPEKPMVDDSHMGRNSCVQFDKGEFREKLSLYVLKDLISAMMHDETSDMDNVIDNSIIRHINDDCKNTCYGYLVNARNKLGSPLFDDIIQEIDAKVDEVDQKIKDTKDPDEVDKVDIKDIVKNVDNYQELADKLRDKVSKEVVDEVSKVILKSNDAPVFDKVNEKVNNDVVKESVIFNMCENVVMEYAMNGEKISTEDGLNIAIVEYCINKLDYLTRTVPRISTIDRYRGRK